MAMLLRTLESNALDEVRHASASLFSSLFLSMQRVCLCAYAGPLGADAPAAAIVPRRLWLR
jgi:hypothetical protein